MGPAVRSKDNWTLGSVWILWNLYEPEENFILARFFALSVPYSPGGSVSDLLMLIAFAESPNTMAGEATDGFVKATCFVEAAVAPVYELPGSP